MECNKDIIIAEIKCFGNYQLISFAKDKLYEEQYIEQTVADAFGIECTPIIFRTARGSEVPKEIIANFILQFSGCASFLLEVVDPERRPSLKRPSDQSLEISSQVLKQHLEDNECQYLFKEYAEKKTLSGGFRRILVNEAVSLLRTKCSNHPTKNEKNAMALAINSLFPDLNSSTGPNIFFDAENNTGYLVTRLKNLNYKRKKLSTCVREESCGTKVTEPSVQQPCLTDGDIEFFKNCVLPQQKSALEERLRNTVKGRNVMCASGANIRISFPFYFVDHELILFDFELKYGKHVEGLSGNWLRYYINLKDVVEDTVSNRNHLTEIERWNSEIRPFLYLLKLLPPTNGRNKEGVLRANFAASLTDFLRFESVNIPTEEYCTDSKGPFIIAVGSNRLAITQYMLVIDQDLIPIPVRFSFNQVFDVFFKAYYVLSINFQKNLVPFLVFFEKYVYKVKNVKASLRQQEIFNKLETKATQSLESLKDISEDLLQDIDLE